MRKHHYKQDDLIFRILRKIPIFEKRIKKIGCNKEFDDCKEEDCINCPLYKYRREMK